MADMQIILVTLSLWIIFIIHVVSLATPYWVNLSFESGSNDVTWHIGLFSVCVTSSSLGGVTVCASYATNMGVSVVHYIQTALLCVAAVLYLTSAIIASTKARQRPTQLDYQHMAGCVIAGYAISAAMIGWLGAGIANLNTTLQSFSFLQSSFNWSFYIAIVSTGLAFLLSIFLCVLRSSAPNTASSGTVMMHNTQQPTVIVQYPNQGYPNQGYPNQAYPNQGYPNQGYPNQGYPNQGYPNQGDPNQGYGGNKY